MSARRWCAALGLCAATLSCSASPATAPPVRVERRDFAELVHEVARLPLRGAVAPLSGPVAILPVGSRIAVLDRKRAELRMYGRDGAMEAMAGTPGDQPGALRKPTALAALDSGRFVVLDDGRRLLSFRDSTGKVLREAKLPDGSFTSVVPLRAERRLIVAGRIYYGADSVRSRPLHEFDYEGHLIASLGEPSNARTKWERAFAGVMVVASGDSLVMGALASNQLRYMNRGGATTGVTRVAAGWYRPVEFPAERLLDRGATSRSASQLVTDVTHASRLLNGVFSLGRDRVLVRFQAFDLAGARFFYYVLSNESGSRYVVSRPTRVNVLGARGDTLYWIADAAQRGATMVRGVAAASTVPSGGAYTDSGARSRR